MEFKKKEPPRKYKVGLYQQIEISDCGEVHLKPDEQVTFVTPSGKQHDFAAKSWGFYATPSINDRLVRQGFKTALVRNTKGQIYLMVVDPEKIKEFEAYLKEEKQQVMEWLHEREKINAS
jgi:hypothetical protein